MEKNEIKTQFILLQTMKYLWLNLTQDMKNLTLKTIKYCWDNSKEYLNR
jgi:hypothetical protein